MRLVEEFGIRSAVELDPAMSRRLGALLGSESSSATSPADAVRRLSALVEVADTVTQQLSKLSMPNVRRYFSMMPMPASCSRG